MMNRRQMIIGSGILSLAGCLRLQDDGGNDDAGSEGDGGAIFSSREEAIESAGGLATDETLDLNQYDGDGPDGIMFSETSGGSSSSTGPDGEIYAATDIDIEPVEGNSTITFGGATDRILQVRDLTTDTMATFRPDDNVDRVDATRLKINTRGNGELREETPTFYDPDREEAATYLSGTWEGETGMFSTYPFGEYVVSINENGTTAAATAGGIHGIGYRFRLDQTETTAFITRHASVDESWEPVLRVNENEVVGSHNSDDRVLEFDIDALSISGGRYDWSVELRQPEPDSPYREYLSIGSGLADPLLIQ